MDCGGCRLIRLKKSEEKLDNLISILRPYPSGIDFKAEGHKVFFSESCVGFTAELIKKYSKPCEGLYVSVNPSIRNHFHVHKFSYLDKEKARKKSIGCDNQNCETCTKFDKRCSNWIEENL